MARRSTKAKKNVRSVNFADEVKWFEPEMEYELVVKAAAWEDGNEFPYIAIEFNGVDDNEDSTAYHNATTSPKALHRLRNLLEALGIEVIEGEPLDIDTDDLIGRHCMGHSFEDEYKGDDGSKKKSVKFDDFWPVEETTGKKKAAGKKDKDDGKSSKKKEPEKLKKSDVEDMDRDGLIEVIDENKLDIDADERKYKKDDKLLTAVLEKLEEEDLLETDEDEAVEKLDRDEVNDMTRKQLVKLIAEHDLDDVDPDSRKLKKDDEALLAAVIEALEEKDLLEPEEKKSSGKAGSKTGSGKSSGKSKSWSEDEIDEMSEEELDKVVETSKIDIDLSEHRTLRKKKNALKDALEEAELIKN